MANMVAYRASLLAATTNGTAVRVEGGILTQSRGSTHGRQHVLDTGMNIGGTWS
jgi:hypothetical protein